MFYRFYLSSSIQPFPLHSLHWTVSQYEDDDPSLRALITPFPPHALQDALLIINLPDKVMISTNINSSNNPYLSV